MNSLKAYKLLDYLYNLLLLEGLMNKKNNNSAFDMYDGAPNQGMRCLIDIINRFSPLVSFDIYDVREM
jgi:hypothetical protein